MLHTLYLMDHCVLEHEALCKTPLWQVKSVLPLFCVASQGKEIRKRTLDQRNDCQSVEKLKGVGCWLKNTWLDKNHRRASKVWWVNRCLISREWSDCDSSGSPRLCVFVCVCQSLFFPVQTRFVIFIPFPSDRTDSLCICCLSTNTLTHLNTTSISPICYLIKTQCRKKACLPFCVGSHQLTLAEFALFFFFL